MKVIYLPVEQIRLQENQFNDLDKLQYEQLLSSIAEYGILEPVHVFKENGNYTLVQGHQRYRAARELMYRELPCVIVEDKETSLAAEYHINLYRRHLTMKEMIGYETDLQEKYKKLSGLIPELKYVQDALPKEMVKVIRSWSQEHQRKFYNALPQKIVENTEEKEKYEKLIEENNERLRERSATIKALKEQIETYEAVKKELETLREAKQADFNKALQLKLKEKEAELKEKYAEESAGSLQARLDREKKRLEREYEKKLEKEIEEYRKLAGRHSKERENVARELEATQKEKDRLEKDIEMYKRSLSEKEQYDEWAQQKLQRFIRMMKVPEQIKAIVKDMTHVRNRIITCKEYLLQLGDAVHEERAENLKAIRELQPEMKKLLSLANDLIILIESPESEAKKSGQVITVETPVTG
ncbi:MAG: ParB N-terminal domain-containing protein [Syntrophorhabdaceae bacterium]|nr:ParB N-terminal domain-containing protein [Syntrophorhabdaceae bacterium]